MLLAISSTPDSDLELTRKRSRARFDFTLSSNWKAFATYGNERRDGSRPFGAVFGGGGGGGNVEIPESIDYNTQDVLAGLQFANPMTNLNLQVTASFFQNDIDTLTFENPLFITTNTIQGVASTHFYARAVRHVSEQRLLELQGGVRQEVPELPQQPVYRRRVTRPVGAERQLDSMGDRAIDGRHHQRRLHRECVEHDRLAEQALGRCAHRHDACRPCDHPESFSGAVREGQVPLLRHRQQHGVLCVQSADGPVGPSVEQRLGRILRDAEPDRWQQSAGYAGHRL